MFVGESRVADGRMALTLDELEQIQSEALADDVEIDLARMQLWAAEEARAYFESGGTVVPAAPPDAKPAPPDAPHAPSGTPTASTAADPALSAFLALHGLDSLALALAGDSLAGHAAALRASGRPAFLAALKCRGVASLTHRQSLATALSKADKAAGGLTAAAAAAGGREPTGGSADASARPLPPPLPPHVRLTRAQLAALAPRIERGEWYGLPQPTSFPDPKPLPTSIPDPKPKPKPTPKPKPKPKTKTKPKTKPKPKPEPGARSPTP